MSKRTCEISCPNCSKEFSVTRIDLEIPKSIITWCSHCYYPLRVYPKEHRFEIRMKGIKKNAFLIHSSDAGEKRILTWFRGLLRLHGLETHVIESDSRPIDWLQKSLEGIRSVDFVIALLTKRYQFTGNSGKIRGWKAPDKCYEEIAMAFALQKPICALVEEEVDPGNVLKTRAWCYKFRRNADKTAPTPIDADNDFFEQLLMLSGDVVRGLV